MSCPTLETSAAWLLDALTDSESEAFEEHYFGCSHCFERVTRLEQLVERLRQALPPTLTTARHAALSARGLPSVDVGPGATGQIRFDAQTTDAVWVMHFAPGDYGRIDLDGFSPSGALLFSMKDVPFDAERGRVFMPCSVHYQVLFDGPPRLSVRLAARATDAGSPQVLGEYILDHVFV